MVKEFLWVSAALAVCLAFTGCKADDSYNIVDDRDLTGLISVPLRDGSAQKSLAEQAQYTGKIAWETPEGAFTGSKFAADTVYMALVTLTAKTGYTFNGLGANSFRHRNGTTANPAGKNAAPLITVSVVFPKTAAEGEQLVDLLDLTSRITAPVKGETPFTVFGNTAQYSGSPITWQNANGSVLAGGAFAAGTVYKAVVTLTAAENWTLSGLEEDSFTYSNAQVLFEMMDRTVTVTFPATAAEGQDTVVNAFGLTALITSPVKGAVPQSSAISSTQYTGVIAWQTSAGGSFSGNFKTLTVYKAVVTLTANSGYTFTGVAADRFTYDGAAQISNAVNSGTVTITFKRTAYEKAYIETNSLSVAVCCWDSSHTPDKMLDGSTSSSNNGFWDYNYNNGNTANTDFGLDVSVSDENGKGHPETLTPLGLHPGHFFTFDLGSVKDVVTLEFFPRNSANQMIEQAELFISDEPIGLNPTGARSVGIGGPWTYAADRWFTLDVTNLVEDGSAVSGRYVQLRIYADGKNHIGHEWIQPSCAEVRIGVNQD